MTRMRALFPILILTLFLAACAQSGSSEEARSASEAPMEAADFDMDTGAASFAGDGVDESFAQSSDLPQTRLIIRTADMGIIVVDTEATMASISRLAEESGGWVVSSNVFRSGSEGAMSGSMTVRVPAEGFQSALDAIQGLALEVSNISTSGQDVTEEYVDLSARLANLEATAERVRGFLAEARNTEEALAVNQELSRLEAEIEVLKGRIQYLQESAAFSTISVNLTPDELSQPIEVAGWRPQGVVRNALEALISALQSLASVLIWFVIFCLPFLIIVGIPAWLIIRYVVRRRRKGHGAPAVEEGQGVPPTDEEETLSS